MSGCCFCIYHIMYNYVLVLHISLPLCSLHAGLVLIMQLSYMSGSHYAVIMHVWL